MAFIGNGMVTSEKAQPHRHLQIVAIVVAIGLIALLRAPGASALTGPQRLTFGEYGEGEPISTQYEGQGVVFQEEDDSGYPYIAWDRSSYEDPVLAGPYGFGSTIKAEFVQPGTVIPATVEALAMDIGYIDEPGSTVLTVETTTGPIDIYADEWGFNHLTSGATNIIGFRIETIGDEDAGWELDNLAYTIPTPPPVPAPAPAAPAPAPTTDPDACPSVNGPIWKQVLTLYSCKSMEKSKCEVALALDFPDLKALKGAEGLYDLDKVARLDKGAVPAAKLYNKVYSIKLRPDAPKGYRTAGEVIGTFKRAKSAADLVRMMPNLAKAMSKEDFVAIFNLMVDFTGVHPCIDLITSW